MSALPSQRLPLVIGVTGHRDVRPQDEAVLLAAIDAIFEKLGRAYPSTPLLLLTPLAEGADRLAAEAALRRSIPYRVPLPMPLAEYREDFRVPGSLARFDELLATADGPAYTLPFYDTNDASNICDPSRRANQYALLAAHLARVSHIFIALWDGKPSQEPGGTAQAVRFRVLGVPPSYDRSTSLIDAPETGPVYHISTARSTNAPLAHPLGFRTLRVARESRADAAVQQSSFEPFARIDERPGDAADPLETLYRRIDGFNADCARLDRRSASEGERNGEAATRSLMRAAENAATHYQRKFVRALQLLFGATAAALLVFELYAHVLTHAHPLVVLYLAASGVAIVTYVRARRGRWQDRAQDYRALEIGLNVQQAWDAAGVDRSVADYYIRRQRSELDWIRDAIRTAHNVDRQRRFDEAGGVATVRAFVLRQYAYFAGSANDGRVAAYLNGERRPGGAEREERRARRYERLSTTALRASFAVSALLIAFGLVSWLAPNLLGAAADDEAVHGAIVFVVASTAIAAAMFHDYSARRAHPQHARRYAAMTGMYRRALDALDEAEESTAGRDPAAGPRKSQIETARECILALGHEALSENGDWLLLHRELPIELLAVG